MAVSNDSIQANLVQVWRFKLQHFVDAFLVDPVGGLADFRGCAIRTSKAGFNELLTVFVE